MYSQCLCNPYEQNLDVNYGLLQHHVQQNLDVNRAITAPFSGRFNGNISGSYASLYQARAAAVTPTQWRGRDRKGSNKKIENKN